MKINFLTLFPNYFKPFLEESIISKAINKNLISFNVIDWREYSRDKHKKVDDTVFGGGQGMLLQIEPIDIAINSLENKGGYKILVSPQGKTFNQKIAKELSQKKEITLISGRYEGFDERISELVDMELSIGDYVLTGGEIPSMVIADAITRLIPNVIKKESHMYESFEEDGMLDYPQYTQPREYYSLTLNKTLSVPKELLNGNHKIINEWREKAKYQKTLKNRPDIIERIKNEK